MFIKKSISFSLTWVLVPWIEQLKHSTISNLLSHCNNCYHGWGEWDNTGRLRLNRIFLMGRLSKVILAFRGIHYCIYKSPIQYLMSKTMWHTPFSYPVKIKTYGLYFNIFLYFRYNTICSSAACLNPLQDGFLWLLSRTHFLHLRLSCGICLKLKYISFDAICVWPVRQMGNRGHQWAGCYGDNQIPRSAVSVCSVSGIMLFPDHAMFSS